MAKYGFYAVRSNGRLAIFKTWANGAFEATNGVPSAYYKGAKTIEECYELLGARGVEVYDSYSDFCGKPEVKKVDTIIQERTSNNNGCTDLMCRTIDKDNTGEWRSENDLSIFKVNPELHW